MHKYFPIYIGLLFFINSIFVSMDVSHLANHRMVLIFGNNSSLVSQQAASLQKDSVGLAERDLIVKTVEPGSNLYQTYQIQPNQPFTVILIGKDGGEKYRSSSILSINSLFAMIDAMPMRQAEMRQTKN